MELTDAELDAVAAGKTALPTVGSAVVTAAKIVGRRREALDLAPVVAK